MAALGYGLEPRQFSSDMHMESRFQTVIAVCTAVSVLSVGLAFWVPETDAWANRVVRSPDQKEIEEISNHRHYTYKQMWLPLVTATVLCFGFQMTGINAVMSYAPKITKSAGFAPLLGNFVVMVWNFVTTIVSIPLAKRFSMRQMFVCGITFCSAACFMIGVPILPGVMSDESLKHWLVGIGLVFYIAAFEFGMGPPFWVLAQMLFPETFRDSGSSFTTFVNFSMNIVINVCFPISVVGFSGGPSGNQDLGMGVVFLIFGGIGVVSVLYLLKFLQPYVETDETQKMVQQDDKEPLAYKSL